MRKASLLFSVCLVFTTLSWSASPRFGRPGLQADQAKTQPVDPEALLAKIAQYEYGASRDALVDFSDYFSSQLSDRKLVSALEKRFIKFLDSNATLAGKDVVCRHLAVIASEESIPVLSKLILKPASFEMARSVLEKIPGEEADKALRDALGKVDDKQRPGLINSIGLRRDQKAVRLLVPLLEQPETIDAAATALARIGDRQGLDALFSAKTTGDEQVRGKVQEALMDWADDCLAERRNQAALLVYRDMTFISEPSHIRVAALRGVVKAAGIGAIPTLLSAIEDGETPVQAAALKLLVQFQSPSVTKQLIKVYPTLPERTKAHLIAAWADGKELTATSFVLGEAKKGSDPVRAAALQALARLGDASCVPLLSAAAADASGPVKEAARTSLYRIPGREVDQAILAALPSAALPVKLELVRAAAERGITAASPVLTQALRDPQGELRREALKALVELGSEADVPALLAFLGSSEIDAEREQAGRALASACRRSGGKGLDQVIAGYSSSASKSQLREALVSVVGNVGSKEGLPLLTGALKDSEPSVRRTAIVALGEWPNAEPISDLLAAAREAAVPAHHVLALRSYLKLVALPSDRPYVESVRLVSSAIEAARDPELKKAALAVLPRFVCQQAIDLATAAGADPAVKAEADQAVKRLKESMGNK